MFAVRSFLIGPLVLAAVTQVAGPAALAAQAEAEVLAVVQELFDAMAARDGARAAAVLLPDGQLVAVRPTPDGGVVPVIMTHGEFVEQVAAAREPWLERLWDPVVMIHDPIAIVWTPYDFFRGDAFSHCGMDAFTMVRTADGWRIAGGVYTVETTGCRPSPLGPPRPNH